MPDRSRRVVVLAHCILNANARYVGGAKYPGANVRALEPYLRDGTGIVQLPCPEVGLLGMERWAATRNQYDTVGFRAHCRAILAPTLDILEEFSAAGYSIDGVLGVAGSPSCGCEVTSEGYAGGRIEDAATHQRVSGRGVMMTVLAEMIAERGLALELTDVAD